MPKPIRLVSKQGKKNANDVGAAFKRLSGEEESKKEVRGDSSVVLDREKMKDMTPMQRKFIELMWENLGNPGGSKKTIEELMLEAGYSPATARSQSGILVPIKEAGILDPLVESLNKRIEWGVNAITKKKVEKQSPYTNALTVDLLLKNRELLTGRGGMSGNVTFNFNNNQGAYFTKVIHSDPRES